MIEDAKAQTGSMWPLEGAFRCGDGFLAAPECLGHTFESRTKSHALSLTLPEIDGASLKRPPWRYVREGEDRGVVATDDHGHWGSIAGGGDNPKYAHVLQCVIHSEVAATDDETFQAAAAKFGDELSDWWALVCDWLDVLTLQDFAGLGRAQRSILDDSVQMWSGDCDGVRRAGVNYQVMAGAMNWVEVLDRQRIELAMSLAASNSSPHIEWLFLRDARSLLNAREYRRALIDACTAAELSVTALIDRKFDLAGTSQTDRKDQFSKNHGLSNLIALHNSFRTGKLPKRLYQEVGAPRNNAAHVGGLSSESEARKAISKSAEVVNLAYPLSAIAAQAAGNIKVQTPPQFGILPGVDKELVLTKGNALRMSVQARRRERPPPRQPPILIGVQTTRRHWWQFWRR
jgi:hypothetical protein